MVVNWSLISLDLVGESLYLEVLEMVLVSGKNWKLLLEQFVQLEAFFLFLVLDLTIDLVLN